MMNNVFFNSIWNYKSFSDHVTMILSGNDIYSLIIEKYEKIINFPCNNCNVTNAGNYNCNLIEGSLHTCIL